MVLGSPAATMSLGVRVDLIARKSNAYQHFYRCASYDNGNTWEQPWVELFPALVEPGGAPAFPFKQPHEYGVASAASGDGRITYLCARADASVPTTKEGARFWLRVTTDFTHTWTDWTPIGEGIFTSSPAIATSGSGQTVMALGRGTDGRMYIAASNSMGKTFETDWSPIEVGTFLPGAPALALSADGKRVCAFGLGTDTKIWSAFSHDLGVGWDWAWDHIGGGLFSSGPAAAMSADGQRLFVIARGLDNKMWFTRSSDGGQTWDIDWTAIPAGTNFTSSATAALSWDGQDLQVFAAGGDRHIWRARSIDGGLSWAVAWSQVGSMQF